MFVLQAATTRAPGGIETAIKHYSRMFQIVNARSLTLYNGPVVNQLLADNVNLLSIKSSRSLFISSIIPQLSSLRKRIIEEANGEDILIIVHSDLMLAPLRRLFTDAVIVSICHSDKAKRKAKSDAIITLNLRQNEIISRELPQLKNDIHMIGNPFICEVNLKSLQPENLPVRRIVFCARFVEAKDPLAILRSYQILDSHAPPLYLFGDGPLLEKAKTFAKLHNVNAHFLGWNTNPWQEISSNDILVVTSTWEGLPFLIQEALANGVPVIASDIAGNRAALQNSSYGYLYETGSDESLASCLAQAIKDPAQLRNKAYAGALALEDNYGAVAFYAKLETLFKQARENRMHK